MDVFLTYSKQMFESFTVATTVGTKQGMTSQYELALTL